MQKPYVIMGNFGLELLDVQCRRGAIRPLGRGSGVDLCEVGGSEEAEVSVAAARQLEGPRLPCEPGRMAAPGAGVTRTVDKLSDAELAELKAKRAPAAAAARKRWVEAAKKGDWDQVRMPGKCFRFAAIKVSPRRSAAYKGSDLDRAGAVGQHA